MSNLLPSPSIPTWGHLTCEFIPRVGYLIAKRQIPTQPHFQERGHAIDRCIKTWPCCHNTGIKYKEALSKDYYGNLKKKINAYLTRELSPNYTYLGQTRVAVQFKYKLPEQGYLSVDLLLSPYWDSQESYWRDLAQIHPPLDRLT